MDASLCLYKVKLKEAIDLVSSMNHERKLEAVAHWNLVAEQLQFIVHKSEDISYNEAPALEQNIHVSASEEQILYTTSECQSITSMDVANANQTTHINLEATLTTTKSAPISQFHEENLLNKSLFESTYLDDSPVPTLNDCKAHLPSLLDAKTNPGLQDPMTTTYAIAQNDVESRLTSLGSTSCSNGTNNPINQYTDMTKLPNMMSQVPVHEMNSKTVINMTSVPDVYCTNINNEPQLNSNGHLIDNIDQAVVEREVSKLVHVPLDSSVEYYDILVQSPLEGSRVTSTDEIGSGQYDRGNKLYDNELHIFDHNQAINQLSSSVVPTRNELFTQSDRPLQEIQQFNSNYYEPYAQHSRNFKYLCCSNCNKQFESQEELERHEQLHSPSGSILTPTSADDLEIDNNNSTEVKREMVTRSESDRTGVSNNQHTCEVCGKSGFSTKGNLKRHLRAHSGEKPFKCEYCDSCFTEKKSLKIHVRRHTGEKPYKCDICGKLFSQTGVLQSHMALHLNERKFDCNKCGKAFRQRSQLKLHLMRHDGVKRLECSTCMAKFLTKGDLERHCRIHTGERPYSCEICKKTFTRQQSLNEHMNRHTGRKPYDCKYCEKTFSEMSACYKHAKTHKRQDQMQQQSQVTQVES